MTDHAADARRVIVQDGEDPSDANVQRLAARAAWLAEHACDKCQIAQELTWAQLASFPPTVEALTTFAVHAMSRVDRLEAHLTSYRERVDDLAKALACGHVALRPNELIVAAPPLREHRDLEEEDAPSFSVSPGVAYVNGRRIVLPGLPLNFAELFTAPEPAPLPSHARRLAMVAKNTFTFARAQLKDLWDL